MKKIQNVIQSLIFSAIIVLSSCGTTSTNENSTSNDAKCAYCGKDYVYKDGYCGKEEGVIGKASEAGYKGGSYCSLSCAEQSTAN